MSEPKQPSGVVAVLTFPDGRPVATVADFDCDAIGGFSLAEAQAYRVKALVKIEAVRVMCHPDVAATLSSYQADRIVGELIRTKGYRLSVIPVNGGSDG